MGSNPLQRHLQKLGNWYRFHRALLLAWLEGRAPRGGARAASFDSDRVDEKGGRRGSLHLSPSSGTACP